MSQKVDLSAVKATSWRTQYGQKKIETVILYDRSSGGEVVHWTIIYYIRQWANKAKKVPEGQNWDFYYFILLEKHHIA